MDMPRPFCRCGRRRVGVRGRPTAGVVTGSNSFSGHDNWGFAGAVLQKQVLTNVLIGVEIYHQTLYETDFPNSDTSFNIGTVIDFTENHHLLFSAGRSFDGPVKFQCYIAYQFTCDNNMLPFWNHTHPNAAP